MWTYVENKDLDELYHYGVLGMKWGVRKDRGTGAGLKRAVNKTSSSIKSGMKQTKKFLTKTKRTAKAVKKEIEEETTEQKKERVLKSRSAKQLYDNADLFTTQELQSAYNRLSLERNIQNLVPKEVSKGKQFVDGTAVALKTTANMLESGTKVYNSVAKIYNAKKDSSADPWPIIGDNSNNKNDNNKNN